MNKEHAISKLGSTIHFFKNTISCLTEADSGYAPRSGMMTVCQQVAHVAHTIDWFFEGAFNPKGFDMNFQEHCKKISQFVSLKSALGELEGAFQRAIQVYKNTAATEWDLPLAPGPVMGGEPRAVILGAIIDHTAHHRGSLAVYGRLLGREPKMPYAE